MLRRKLIWQLFPFFLVITLLTLVVATAYGSFAFHHFYLGQVEQKLHLAADVAAFEVAETLASAAPGDMDALCDKLGKAGDGQMRLTVIASDGKVLGDSEKASCFSSVRCREPLWLGQVEKNGSGVWDSPSFWLRG